MHIVFHPFIDTTDGILAIGISTACIVASIKIGGAEAGDAGIVNDPLIDPTNRSSHRVFWPRALSPHQIGRAGAQFIERCLKHVVYGRMVSSQRVS